MELQPRYSAGPKKIRMTSLDTGIMVSFATSRGLFLPSPVMTTQGKKRVDLKMMNHMPIAMAGQMSKDVAGGVEASFKLPECGTSCIICIEYLPVENRIINYVIFSCS